MELDSSENFAQVKKDELSFQVYSSKGYLQDFHHLDHYQSTGNLLSNPVFNDQNPGFDPFVPYSYDCSSNNNVVGFEDQNGGCGQVMDNFQNGEYCYNFHHHQRNHNIDILNNFQEIRPINFVVPDEVSCITSGNAYIEKVIMNNDKNGTLPSLMRTYKVRKKPNVIKGQWTAEEDRLLVELVEQYGVRKWSHIAQMLPGRIGKQCRERWHNHLRPDIKKDTWSEEEDRVLIEAHAEIGNKWAEIAKRLPGRTENSIKNHWNATKRRQYSKRKCRSKYPRCSLLQDYIKSLNLDSNTTTRSQRKNPSSISSAAKLKSAGHRQPQPADVYSNDRFVANIDFNDDLEFCFNDNIFQEVCSLNSLIIDDIDSHKRNDDMGNLEYCASFVIEEKFEADSPVVDLAVAGMVEFEVKKELDLVEMITQVNEVKNME